MGDFYSLGKIITKQLDDIFINGDENMNNNITNEFVETKNIKNVYINKNGKIIGKSGKEIHGRNLHGYLYFHNIENNKSKNYPIHRLVLETFNPVKNMENLQVNHINGIKTDNRLENLEWCTAKENIHHAIENNLANTKAFNNGRHKLTQEAIDDIKNNCIPFSKEYSQAKFAKKYHCSSGAISNVFTGKSYNSIFK